MGIDTRFAAENAATVAVPNEVACGRRGATGRGLSFRFGADRQYGGAAIQTAAATESC